MGGGLHEPAQARRCHFGRDGYPQALNRWNGGNYYMIPTNTMRKFSFPDLISPFPMNNNVGEKLAKNRPWFAKSRARNVV